MTDLSELIAYLFANGFKRAGADPSYDRGRVRVTITDDEAGTVTVTLFTPRPARLIQWSASFAGVPAELVARSARFALDSAAAEMIPGAGK